MKISQNKRKEIERLKGALMSYRNEFDETQENKRIATNNLILAINEFLCVIDGNTGMFMDDLRTAKRHEVKGE